MCVRTRACYATLMQPYYDIVRQYGGCRITKSSETSCLLYVDYIHSTIGTAIVV